MIIRKIASFFLVVVFLAFSGGVHIGKHFCKGELIDLAINSEVDKCSKSISPEFPEKGLALSQLSCCNTEIDFYQSDYSQIVQSDLSTTITFTNNPLFQLIDLVKIRVGKEERIPPLLTYHAPPLFILHESYLI